VNVAAHLGAGRETAVKALEGAGLQKTGEFAHSVNFRHVTGEPVQLAFDLAFDAISSGPRASTLQELAS
jgi:hypothetical protein